MRLTITALTATLLMTTAAIADSDMKKSSIDALPEKGAVTLSGTVERIVDGDTFILRDAAGKTIDVHTNTAFNLQKGESVTIKGQKDAEIAGMGREITAASIVGGKATADKHAADKRATAETRTVASNAVDPTDTPYANRNNRSDLPNTSYDVDIDRTKDGVKVSAERAPDVKRDAAGVAIRPESNTASKATGASATASTNHASADVNARSSIEALPEAGNVSLNGVVSRVSGNDTFTLEDSAGKTINVQTSDASNVKKGDSVKVDGQMSDRLLGFGRQIEGAQVIVVGSN